MHLEHSESRRRELGRPYRYCHFTHCRLGFGPQEATLALPSHSWHPCPQSENLSPAQSLPSVPNSWRTLSPGCSVSPQFRIPGTLLGITPDPSPRVGPGPLRLLIGSRVALCTLRPWQGVAQGSGPAAHPPAPVSSGAGPGPEKTVPTPAPGPTVSETQRRVCTFY